MTKATTAHATVEARLVQIEESLTRALDLTQKNEIRQRIEHSIELAAKTRREPMTNADEPAHVFLPHDEKRKSQ